MKDSGTGNNIVTKQGMQNYGSKIEWFTKHHYMQVFGAGLVKLWENAKTLLFTKENQSLSLGILFKQHDEM